MSEHVHRFEGVEGHGSICLVCGEPEPESPSRCSYDMVDGGRMGLVRCSRDGYETYARGQKVIRCWQHDPLRGVDEGEEAYREHAR